MPVSVIIPGAAGRMGSTLCTLVGKAEDLELAAVLERTGMEAGLENYKCLKGSDLAQILPKCPGAVVVEFTAPEVSMEHARLAAATWNPVVLGTTGLNAEQLEELKTLAHKCPIFFSPNMSLGINVLLDILPGLTRALGDMYDAELMEIHHNRKKDAPSGTALRLGEAVAQGREKNLADVACYHREGIIGERPHGEIGMQALRGGDVVGVHTVYYFGPGERIEITHQAHSRENFAQGALRAVRWMATRKSGKLWDMQDLLHDARESAPAAESRCQ